FLSFFFYSLAPLRVLHSFPTRRSSDLRDLHDKGLKLRREIFGREAVEQRMNAFGAFGEPLQNMINTYAYGDVWSRSTLPLKTKSDRKSTRLNSSHQIISYAVFCLKKKT